MLSIDDSIKRIDDVICRHLDNVNGSTRGAVSQDILEQLYKFTSLVMLKFYSNGRDIAITEENITKATEFAQIHDQITPLFKFHNFLKIVTMQVTLDEDGSERLMLKYYRYLLKAKKLLKKYFNIQVLHNLHKFPLRLDSTLQEYYTKIAEKIDQYPTTLNVVGSNKYYIQKIKPFYVQEEEYFEVTFTPVDDKKNKSKSNRVIAFTKLPIINNYASKFYFVNETIEILGQTMPITIIGGWEVSIRDCEFQNFIYLIKGNKYKVGFPEKTALCNFITTRQKTLTELIDYPEWAYQQITQYWKNELKSTCFIPILDYCRDIIHNKRPGHNILRYLLFNMNNVIIKNQRGNVPNINLSKLYLANGCKPFDSLPFNRSPLGHNPKLGILCECIPTANRQAELFARNIRNNTETKGQLFTPTEDIIVYQNINNLILEYNNSLWNGHRPRSELRNEYNQVFINEYKIDTCFIIKELKHLSLYGIENYEDSVDTWLFFEDYEIDCEEKQAIIKKIFSNSKVGVIYGSAGVGKSTLINHVSHYMNNHEKLYLTQTNPAKENLIRKIDAENTTFSTIASFLKQNSDDIEYELLVIDECSTVSNRDMVAILRKAKFKCILLVGDTYQIDAIQFGNWFSVLKSFLPESAVFELTKPHRTNDQYLLELWDKVRHMDEHAKEIIERESTSLKVDTSLLTSINDDEAILCLNYDGLYGINNINRFLQESNPFPAVQWDVQQYKIGDPILFLEPDRFQTIVHNNMKGIIVGVTILSKDAFDERIQFDIEIPKLISFEDTRYTDIELIESDEENEKSIIRLLVFKNDSSDEDGETLRYRITVPFQIAYAVSIHKAQGLEYNSVKIVITDEVEDLVTHNIFYTAITRAREKLKIYWTPEVEEKVLNRIKPKDISKDVEILKKYLT